MKVMNPEDDKEQEKAYTDFAESLLDAEKEDKEAKKKILQEGIADREKQYSDEISSSKIITEKLGQMRNEADLSPFIGTSGEIKSPKFRRGEFITLLAREVLYIGREEMKEKGGIVSLEHMQKFFEDERENWKLREKDIPEAIELLQNEDLIAKIEEVNDHKLIYFRAIELTEDPRKVIEASFGIETTKERLISILGWSEERLNQAIKLLVDQGIAIDNETEVFFPGLS